MSDKKNEDFVVKMPESGMAFNEKDPFMGRNSAPRPRVNQNSALQQFYAKIDNSPGASITAYCMASISMTVVNKYVVSGADWNLPFFYLAIQVCRGPRRPQNMGLASRTDMCMCGR
jgi:GDP-mannose transporter